MQKSWPAAKKVTKYLVVRGQKGNSLLFIVSTEAQCPEAESVKK